MTERTRILAADKRAVFRPFTSAEDHAAEESLVVVGGEGPFVHDASGLRLFDASGAWWCNHLGFQHPRLVAALRDQASTLCHAAMAQATHEHAALLAEELVAVAPPGITRVFYADNGSTAVEIAAKLAFQYWQQNGRPERRVFLTLGGGYHGDTVGAMSLGGLDAFHRTFHPLLFTVGRAPEASDAAGFERAFEFILSELERAPDTIAGVFLEPVVQGAAGMRFYDPAWLRKVREATNRCDTFLIVDEVFTGYGRTGPMWAIEHAGVAPDLLCTAKGLTAGTLPFGAVLVSERIYEGFRGGPGRAFLHGHTFYGHALGARVAREVLAVFRDEDVLATATANAAILAEGFARIGTIAGTSGARALGMIGAVELGAPGYFGRLGWEVEREARARGVALRPLGNTVYVVPPLNTREADLRFMLGVLEDAIRVVLARSSVAER